MAAQEFISEIENPEAKRIQIWIKAQFTEIETSD
jgi:hypothetical protein